MAASGARTLRLGCGCTIHPATLTPLARRACECRELVWSPNTPSESRKVLSQKRHDVVLVLAMVSAALTGGGTRTWRLGSGSTTHLAILTCFTHQVCERRGPVPLCSLVVVRHHAGEPTGISSVRLNSREWDTHLEAGGWEHHPPSHSPLACECRGRCCPCSLAIIGRWLVVSRLSPSISSSSIMPSLSVVRCGLRLRCRRALSTAAIFCHPTTVVFCCPSSSVVHLRRCRCRPSSSFGVVWQDRRISLTTGCPRTSAAVIETAWPIGYCRQLWRRCPG